MKLNSMKTALLFLGILFLAIACSTKINEKELSFYKHLLEEEIAEVKHAYSGIQFTLTTQHIRRDTGLVLKVARLIDSADIYAAQNKLQKMQQLIISELQAVKVDTVIYGQVENEIKKGIDDMRYLDSMHTLQPDSLSGLKYKIGLYSNLKNLIKMLQWKMGNSCFPGRPSSVQYQSKSCIVNDTFCAIVSPCQAFNSYVEKFKFDQLEVQYLPNYKKKNFTLVNVATKDTVPITIQAFKTSLLITTVFKEKGDYLLSGYTYIEDPAINFFEIYSTNTIIKIR